ADRLIAAVSPSPKPPNRVVADRRDLPMSLVLMRLVRAFSVAALTLTAVPAAISPASAADANGTQAVRTLYATLLDAMHRGPSLGGQGGYARIVPVVTQVFDIPFMTRLAVGPSWASLSEAQRQQVTQAFERYIAAVYAERFDSFSGERLEVIGSQN